MKDSKCVQCKEKGRENDYIDVCYDCLYCDCCVRVKVFNGYKCVDCGKIIKEKQ